MKKFLKLGIASLSLAALASAGLGPVATVLAEEGASAATTVVAPTNQTETVKKAVVVIVRDADTGQVILSARPTYLEPGAVETFRAPAYRGAALKEVLVNDVPTDKDTLEISYDSITQITSPYATDFGTDYLTVIEFKYSLPTEEKSSTDSQLPASQDLSANRNQLLLELDKSNLSATQKGQLAEKIAFAETSEALSALRAEFSKLMQPAPRDVSADRNQLLLDLDKSNLSAAQKSQLAEKIAFAETSEALSTLRTEFSKLTQPALRDLAADRNKLLLDLDKSSLSAAQKSQLAEKIAFAETAKDLDSLKEEFEKLTRPSQQKSAPKAETAKPAAAKSNTKTLPKTGDATQVGLLIGGLTMLLSGFGLAKKRED